MQQHTAIRTSPWFLSSLMLLVVVAAFATTQNAIAQTEEANPLRADNVSLSAKQARLADRYDRLELLAGRLAELSRSTQPRRAQLLRELIAKSRERDVAGRFDRIVAALETESLGKATKGQGELQTDLQKMLNLLLQEDRDQQIDSERKRIKKYLGEVKRLIQLQRGIKARTDGGDEAEQLKQNQQKLAESTENLANEIKTNEGTESESGESNEDSSKSTPKGPESKKPAGESSGQKSEGEQKPSEEKSDGEKADGKETEDEKSREPKAEAKPGEKSEAKDSSHESPQTKPSEGEKSNSESQPSPDSKPSDSPPSESEGDSSPQSPSGEPRPSEQSQSPAERAEQRLKEAQQRMEQALEELEEAKRDNAVERQEEALRELEQAKAELERILRQLREEEKERMLVLLEARFRKMLDAQVAVYEETKKIDASLPNTPEHEIEIAAGRLDRKERDIIREADRALVLLREDGTTVAFPEAIEQARDDMQNVAKRLGEVKIGELTQGIEEDIIAALEETLAALQQAIKESREQQSQQQQQQQRSQGEPGDQPLVDQLAELRMIRALQNRINRSTERYGKILEGKPAIEADLIETLGKLSVRQERVFRALRDLDSGRNK